MEEKKVMFCEIEFLEKYKESYYSDSRYDNINQDDVLTGVGKCIRQSILMIDVDENIFLTKHQTYPPILNMRKKYTGGECQFLERHSYRYVENINADPAMRVNTVCLIDKVGGICRSYAGKYGTIVFSPLYWSNDNEAKNHTYLFENTGVTIEEGDILKWDEILKPKYNLSNCNSMIVVDNYIFKNISDLEHILDALLPKPLSGGLKREDIFYLTIITAKDKSNEARNDEKKFTELKDKIKKLRPYLEYELDIFVEQQSSSNTFHDRYILTNNVMIKSGSGFGLSDGSGRANKLTKIDIVHPYIQSNDKSSKDEYFEIIKRAYAKIIKCTTSGRWKHYPENKKCRNRLICE